MKVLSARLPQDNGWTKRVIDETRTDNGSGLAKAASIFTQRHTVGS